MGICSVSFHLFFFSNNSPLRPTQTEVYKIKSCCCSPSQFPPWKATPVGSLSSIQEDKERGDSAVFFASLSFLSNGLEMYYYANVNFDTELKKRLFVLFSKKKKKVPYVVSIASLFCKWIVNYAFCKGGVGDKDSFAKLFRSFCVHGRSITVWGVVKW